MHILNINNINPELLQDFIQQCYESNIILNKIYDSDMNCIDFDDIPINIEYTIENGSAIYSIMGDLQNAPENYLEIDNVTVLNSKGKYIDIEYYIDPDFIQECIESKY